MLSGRSAISVFLADQLRFKNKAPLSVDGLFQLYLIEAAINYIRMTNKHFAFSLMHCDIASNTKSYKLSSKCLTSIIRFFLHASIKILFNFALIINYSATFYIQNLFITSLMCSI